MPRMRKRVHVGAKRTKRDDAGSADDSAKSDRSEDESARQNSDDAPDEKSRASHSGKTKKVNDKKKNERQPSPAPSAADSSSDTNYSPTRQLRDRKQIAKPESYVEKYAVKKPPSKHPSKPPTSTPPPAQQHQKDSSQQKQLPQSPQRLIAPSSSAAVVVKNPNAVAQPSFLSKTRQVARPVMKPTTKAYNYRDVKSTIVAGPPYIYVFKPIGEAANSSRAPARVSSQTPLTLHNLQKLQAQYLARRMTLAEAPACSLPSGPTFLTKKSAVFSPSASFKPTTALPASFSQNKVACPPSTVTYPKISGGASAVSGPVKQRPPLFFKTNPPLPEARLQESGEQNSDRKRFRNNGEQQPSQSNKAKSPQRLPLPRPRVTDDRPRPQSPDDIEIIHQTSAAPAVQSPKRIFIQTYKPRVTENATEAASSVPTTHESPPPIGSGCGPTNLYGTAVGNKIKNKKFLMTPKRSSQSNTGLFTRVGGLYGAESDPARSNAAQKQPSPPRIVSSLFGPSLPTNSNADPNADTNGRRSDSELRTVDNHKNEQRVVYKVVAPPPRSQIVAPANKDAPVSSSTTKPVTASESHISQGIDAAIARAINMPLNVMESFSMPSVPRLGMQQSAQAALSGSRVPYEQLLLQQIQQLVPQPPPQQRRNLQKVKPVAVDQSTNASDVVRQVNFVAYTPSLDDPFWTVVRNGLKRALPNLQIVANDRVCQKFVDSSFCYEDLNFRLERPLFPGSVPSSYFNAAHEFYTIPRAVYKSSEFCEHRHASLVEILLRSYSIFTTNCALAMYQHLYAVPSITAANAEQGSFDAVGESMSAENAVDGKIHVPALKSFRTWFGSFDVFVEAMRDAEFYKRLLAELLAITLHCSYEGLESGVCVAGLQTGLDDVISDDNATDDLKRQDAAKMSSNGLPPSLYKKLCSSLSFVQLVDDAVRAVLEKPKIRRKSRASELNGQKVDDIKSPSSTTSEIQQQNSPILSPNVSTVSPKADDANKTVVADDSNGDSTPHIDVNDSGDDDEQSMTLYYWYILLRAFSNNLCTIRDYQRDVGKCQQLQEPLLKWLAIADPEFLRDFELCETNNATTKSVPGDSGFECGSAMEYEFTKWLTLIEQSGFGSDCWPSDTRIRFVSFLLLVMDMVVPEIHTLNLERHWQDIRRRLTQSKRHCNSLQNSLESQLRNCRRAQVERRVKFSAERTAHEEELTRLNSAIEKVKEAAAGEQKSLTEAEIEKTANAEQKNVELVGKEPNEVDKSAASPANAVASTPPEPTASSNGNSILTSENTTLHAADEISSRPVESLETLQAHIAEHNAAVERLDAELEPALAEIAASFDEPTSRIRTEIAVCQSGMSSDERAYGGVVYVRNLVRSNVTFVGIDRHFNHYAMLEQLNGHPLVVSVRKDVEPSPLIEGNCLSHSTATVAPCNERDAATNIIHRRVRVKQADSAYGDLSFYPDTHLQMWHFARTQPAGGGGNPAPSSTPGTVPQFKLTRATRLAIGARSRLSVRSSRSSAIVGPPNYFDADRARDRFHFDQMDLYAQYGKVFCTNATERDQVFPHEHVKFQGLAVIPLELPPPPPPRPTPRKTVAADDVEAAAAAVATATAAVQAASAALAASEAAATSLEKIGSANAEHEKNEPVASVANEAETPKSDTADGGQQPDLPTDDDGKVDRTNGVVESAASSDDSVDAVASPANGSEAKSTSAENDADKQEVVEEAKTITAPVETDVRDTDASVPADAENAVRTPAKSVNSTEVTASTGSNDVGEMREDGLEDEVAAPQSPPASPSRNESGSSGTALVAEKISSEKSNVLSTTAASLTDNGDAQEQSKVTGSDRAESPEQSQTGARTDAAEQLDDSAIAKITSPVDGSVAAAEEKQVVGVKDATESTAVADTVAAGVPEAVSTVSHVAAASVISSTTGEDEVLQSLMCVESLKNLDSTPEPLVNRAANDDSFDDIEVLHVVEKAAAPAVRKVLRPWNSSRITEYMDNISRFAASLNRKGVRERILFDGVQMFVLPRMAMMHAFYSEIYQQHFDLKLDAVDGTSTSALAAMVESNELVEIMRNELARKAKLTRENNNHADTVESLNDAWLRTRFATFDTSHRLMLRRYNAILVVLFERMPELGRRYAPHNISSVLLLIPFELSESLWNVEELSLLEYDFFRLWAHRLQCINAALAQYKTLDERRVQRLFNNHLNDVVDLITITEFRMNKYRICQVAVYFMSVALLNLQQIMEAEPALEEEKQIVEEKMDLDLNKNVLQGIDVQKQESSEFDKTADEEAMESVEVKTDVEPEESQPVVQSADPFTDAETALSGTSAPVVPTPSANVAATNDEAEKAADEHPLQEQEADEAELSSAQRSKKHKHHHRHHHKKRRSSVDGGTGEQQSSSKSRKHKKSGHKHSSSREKDENGSADDVSADRHAKKHRHVSPVVSASENQLKTEAGNVSSVAADATAMLPAVNVPSVSETQRSQSVEILASSSANSNASLTASTNNTAATAVAGTKFFSNDGRPLRLTSKRARLMK